MIGARRGREQDRIALGDGLVREPLEHHRRAVRRRREPRTLVRHAGLGASAELEAQFAQPCAVHVTGGCSNTTVTFSNPSERSSAAAASSPERSSQRINLSRTRRATERLEPHGHDLQYVRTLAHPRVASLARMPGPEAAKPSSRTLEPPGVYTGGGPCCCIVVRTSETARSFTSGGYRLDDGCFCWAMDPPPFPRFGVSIKPRALHLRSLPVRGRRRSHRPRRTSTPG